MRALRDIKKDKGINQALDRSCGGFSTKVHILTEGLGYPVDFVLTRGQAHDAPQAQGLLTSVAFDQIIVDKAYDDIKIRELVVKKGAKCIIPSKSNRINKFDHDQHVYKERHLIECCIGKLKQFRRVFSRFEKRACRYLSFLKIASTILWLR
ncbi:Transposase [Piscirickettsia salmonis]|uniref:Transposase n=1 Tax=Piscirickettsia salmonis TaxID=1238 RepID=A0A9Q6LKW4_PISSA|nr:IS5 family transposase [Piscirickettsia salmonis]ALA24830.1 transposase [Piscirickettsia salmonis]QGN95232.1 Transposase [Piscirickettsia salmonis]QGN95247.1 Transposase [Piscirickettsia salmonis]QGO05804.1 Transposase [Piscirickettsia salmonis]QGO05819.1 Transposase [Piscirickettsia salmonis]